MDGRRLLVLMAHPDDETFGPGATIARYASEGADVFLVTATRGEAGMVGDPPVTDRAHLGEVRAAELEAAAKVLGIRKVVFLGFRDGGLAETPPDRIVGKTTEQIRRIRPHVMIGFGPEGVSRHPDHVVMCRAALEAFDAAADPGRYPGQLTGGVTPWEVSKLYQFEVAQEIFEAWGIPFKGIPRERLTAFIDTRAFIETKIRAFYAHRTQKKDYDRILAREGFREMAARETYVLARTRLPRGDAPETDLFEGIVAGADGKDGG